MVKVMTNNYNLWQKNMVLWGLKRTAAICKFAWILLKNNIFEIFFYLEGSRKQCFHKCPSRTQKCHLDFADKDWMFSANTWHLKWASVIQNWHEYSLFYLLGFCSNLDLLQLVSDCRQESVEILRLIKSAVINFFFLWKLISNAAAG